MPTDQLHTRPLCEVCSAPSVPGTGVQLCSACALALDRAYEQLQEYTAKGWGGVRASLNLDKSKLALVRLMQFARDRAAVVGR